LISKMQPVIIIATACIGILLGQNLFFSDNAGGLIEPFLMILLFFVFLKIDLKDIGKSFMNTKFTVTSLLMNFVWTPLFAVLLGYLFLGESMDMRIGFLMLLVTPCTDWYLVFTGIAKGNVPLSAAILPMNLIIQVLLLPVYLLLFVGSGTYFDMGSILLSIVFVLVIPLVLANLTRFIIDQTGRKERSKRILDAQGDNLQLLFLCLAVVVMFASQGDAMVNNPTMLIKMFVPLGIFFMVNFAIARMIGRKLGFSFDDTTSLTFTTLARNSPLALAIAVAAFPDNPLMALVLVIGPLLELPVLSLVSSIILRMRENITA
jgi:Arsenite efflux pump ACR3 and related permeases